MGLSNWGYGGTVGVQHECGPEYITKGKIILQENCITLCS